MGPHDMRDVTPAGAIAGKAEMPAKPARKPFAMLNDAELVAEARRLYLALQETPGHHDDHDTLLRDFGIACAEMNFRGLTDNITTGHAATDRPHTSNARLRVIFTSEGGCRR
jgi:hypothetical protein